MTANLETALSRRAEDPPMVQLIRQYEGDLAAALPEGMTVSRFQSIIVNSLRQTPGLLQVEPMTLIASALMAAQLGLEPGAPLGLSWIVPRRNQGRQEASFQIGYQGLRQLAYRSGVVSTIEARIVYEGDTFDYAYGLGGVNWSHKPSGEAGADWTHVYCAAQLANGGEMFEVMTKAQVHEHRDRYVPQWAKSKAWREQEPEMARKTATARLCRQLPMSVEFRSALAADGATPRDLEPNLAYGLDIVDVEDEGEQE